MNILKLIQKDYLYRGEVTSMSYEDCNEDWDDTIEYDNSFCALGMNGADSCAVSFT